MDVKQFNFGGDVQFRSDLAEAVWWNYALTDVEQQLYTGMEIAMQEERPTSRAHSAERWVEVMHQFSQELAQLGRGDFPLILEKIRTRGGAQLMTAEVLSAHQGRQSWVAETIGYEYGAHKRDIPAAAVVLVLEECCSPASEAAFILNAWSTPEFPEDGMPAGAWREIFMRHNWISDDDAPAPQEPLELFRGATPERKNGLAWTTEYDRAVWFAERFAGASSVDTAVYRTVATPTHMKASLAARGEAEIIAVDVEPELVTVCPAPMA